MIELVVIALFFLVLGFGAGVWTMNSQPKLTSWDRVKEFHIKFGHPAPDTPGILDDGRAMLRIALVEEELDELKAAVREGDLVAIADALGDLDYVVNGAAIEHGIHLPSVTAEIHRSNMTKLGPDGKPIYREDGKILKGEGYEPPNLAPLLA